MLVPQLDGSAGPQAHTVQREAEVVGGGQVAGADGDAAREHEFVSRLSYVLDRLDEHARLTGRDLAGWGIGAVLVVGLLADDRRVEDADDAHPLAGVPRDPVPVGRADAVQDAGRKRPLFPGAAILENAAAERT